MASSPSCVVCSRLLKKSSDRRFHSASTSEVLRIVKELVADTLLSRASDPGHGSHFIHSSQLARLATRAQRANV